MMCKNDQKQDDGRKEPEISKEMLQHAKVMASEHLSWQSEK
jgi:hypothetical protein